MIGINDSHTSSEYLTPNNGPAHPYISSIWQWTGEHFCDVNGRTGRKQHHKQFPHLLFPHLVQMTGAQDSALEMQQNRIVEVVLVADSSLHAGIWALSFEQAGKYAASAFCGPQCAQLPVEAPVLNLQHRFSTCA
jgi:hypothetical protein